MSAKAHTASKSQAAGRRSGLGGKSKGGTGSRAGDWLSAGFAGDCACPACGKRVPHRPSTPCFKDPCPSCGAAMVKP